MLVKTAGIVLGYTRFRETSIIVKIFTRELGRQTYLVNGVRKAGTKGGGMALFQPFTLLDMVVYHQPNREINRISEYRTSGALHHTQTDVKRMAIAMFAAEALAHVAKQDHDMPELFDAVTDWLQALQQDNAVVGRYPVLFCRLLAEHLGVMPEQPQDWPGKMPPAEVLEAIFDRSNERPVAGKEVMDALLMLLQETVEGFGELKSPEVLRVVFS